MGSTLLVVLVAIVLSVAVVAAALMTPPRRHAPGRRTTHTGLSRLRRVSLATRAAAVLTGAALVVLATRLGGLGRGVALAPVIFGGCQVLGILIADALARDSARSPGVAALEVRRARDLLPARLTRVTSGATMLLGGLLIWTTLVASADDQGRAGRSLSYRCLAECDHASVGPWPGSYYSLPMTLGILAVALLAVFTLRHTARRPRNGADPEVLRVDGATRRRAADSTVAGLGVAVSGSLAGVAAMVGARLIDADHAPAMLSAARWPAVVLALGALAVTMWCVTILLLPGPGPAPESAGSVPRATGAVRSP